MNSKWFYTAATTHSFGDDPLKVIMDSVQLFYERSNDTIVYWVLSGTAYLDNEDEYAREFIREEKLGAKPQRGRTLNNGNIQLHRFRPQKYLVRNDSLYEWDEEFKYFRFIFSPQLFSSSNLETSIHDSHTNSTITLSYKWRVGDQEFYRVLISTDYDGGRHWEYLLSDKFDFLGFGGGWTSKEATILNRSNLVIDNVFDD